MYMYLLEYLQRYPFSLMHFPWKFIRLVTFFGLNHSFNYKIVSLLFFLEKKKCDRKL